MLLEASEDEDVPFPLVAVIVKVYACPLANEPVTVKGLEVPDVLSDIDGLDVTV
jgi:hypothetical protein